MAAVGVAVGIADMSADVAVAARVEDLGGSGGGVALLVG